MKILKSPLQKKSKLDKKKIEKAIKKVMKKRIEYEEIPRLPLVFWGMGGKLTFSRLADMVDKHIEKHGNVPSYIGFPQELYDRYVGLMLWRPISNMSKKLFFYGSDKPIEIMVSKKEKK